MLRALRDKWVTALRSGDYKQGLNRLCEEKPDGTTTWCCLGVLLNVAKQPYKTEGWPNDQRRNYGPNVERYSGSYYLPNDFRVAQGITRSQQLDLIRMNDGSRGDIAPQSFNAIADWIEKNIEVTE